MIGISGHMIGSENRDKVPSPSSSLLLSLPLYGLYGIRLYGFGGSPVRLVEVLSVCADALDVSWKLSTPPLPALTRWDVVQNRAVLAEASGLAAVILEAAPVWQAALVIHLPGASFSAK